MAFIVGGNTFENFRLICPSKGIDVYLDKFNLDIDSAINTVWKRVTFISQQFGYTGTVEEFVAPATGTYLLEVWGAQGGNYGGLGGYSYGTIDLNEGDILYVCVGGCGTANTNGLAAGTSGGYNGGGDISENPGTIYSTGGGATHIAAIENLGELANYSENQDYILIVAGGGGGAGGGIDDVEGATGEGGSGGGLAGGAGSVDSYGSTATGGTQTEGGSPGDYSEGTSGTFGKAGNSGYAPYGGTGGGGWYGGGSSSQSGGGAGGSGYIDGVSNGVTESGTWVGYGHARITYKQNADEGVSIPYYVTFTDYLMSDVSRTVENAYQSVTTDESGYHFSCTQTEDVVYYGNASGMVNLLTQGCNKVRIKYTSTYFQSYDDFISINDVVCNTQSTDQYIYFDCTGNSFTLSVDLSNSSPTYELALTINEIYFYNEET